MIIQVDTKDIFENVMQSELALLLKHSTRCPISARALREFQSFDANYGGQAKLFLVDVIRRRDVSTEIEKRTGVTHQSPQLLVIAAGSVEWHGSHGTITRTKIEETLGGR